MDDIILVVKIIAAPWRRAGRLLPSAAISCHGLTRFIAACCEFLSRPPPPASLSLLRPVPSHPIGDCGPRLRLGFFPTGGGTDELRHPPLSSMTSRDSRDVTRHQSGRSASTRSTNERKRKRARTENADADSCGSIPTGREEGRGIPRDVNFARERFGNYNRKLAQLADTSAGRSERNYARLAGPDCGRPARRSRDVSRGIIQRAGNNDVDIVERIRSGGGGMEERNGEI